MASRSAQHEPEKAEVIEELLETVDKTLDRVKVLYEQFFLGIQKQPPTHLHNDVERKLRDLQQMQIRNTGLRYRFATIQQKFGSYNNYWRRTLRQIENGTYARNLAKLSRKAIAAGEDIPDEILASMPKRMREQVRKDREAALALQQRRRQGGMQDDELLDEPATQTQAPTPKTRDGAHVLTEDEDFDLDAYFAAVTNDDAKPIETPAPPAPAPRTAASSTPAMRAAGVRIAPAQPKPVAPPPDFEDEEDSFVHSAKPRDVEPRPSTGIPLRVGRNTPVQGVPVVNVDDDESTSPIAVAPRPPIGKVTPVAGQPAVRPATPNITQPIGSPMRSPTPRPSSAPGAEQPARPSTPQVTQPIGSIRATPVAGQPAVRPTTSPGAEQPARPTTSPGAEQPARPTTSSGSVQPLATQALPKVPAPAMPSIPKPPVTSAASMPTQPIPKPAAFAPSQVSRPLPVMPGASAKTGPVAVESMNGPFPREPPPPPEPQPAPRPIPKPPIPTQPIKPMKPARAQTEPGVAPKLGPPPGMTDADVNALYAKYVKAKEAVGEKPGPGSYGKLLQTINAQAPKIMEQYKAKSVDFQVVVKDNQVVIRAKPKP